MANVGTGASGGAPEAPGGGQPDSGRLQGWVAALLVACVAVAVFWQLMANRSRSPLKPFDLTAEDFAGFALRSEAWSSQRLPVSFTPTEPNVIAYRLERREPGAAHLAPFARLPMRARLSHGYNMRDCMRLKGYTVDLLADTRRAEPGSEPLPAPPTNRSDLVRLVPAGRQVQIWRLTPGAGDVAIYVTGMLRAGDFSETGADLRSMPFPRILVPEEAGWMPRGLRLSSLRHPIRNFRALLRAKWNNARCDLPTFLRLRQPAWASEEMLTLVMEWKGPSIPAGGESAAAREVLASYFFFQGELQSWRRSQTAGIP